MRSSRSSSSSSSYSLTSMSLINRLKTVFKKAKELSILCGVDVCVIYYAPDGTLKTWPEEKSKVVAMALRYARLSEDLKGKKRVHLSKFLSEKKDKEGLVKKNIVDVRKFSPDQRPQLIQTLELNVSKLEERLRFLESQEKLKLEDHQTLASSSSSSSSSLDIHQPTTPQSLNPPGQSSSSSLNIPQPTKTQSLNPLSQISLVVLNHADNTLSQIPLSASNINQEYLLALLQQSQLKNNLMNQELCGYDQNMCISGITNNNNSFQHPCLVSNTLEYSAPAVQESVNNFGLNQVMQKEYFYGCDQNMCGMGDINSNSFQNPCLVSNTEQYSAVQESMDYSGLNQLMPHEPYGYDQNMYPSF